MIKTAFIKDINPDLPQTWQDKVFLTIDIDWAHEQIIEETLEIIHKYKINATLFVTNKSNALFKWCNSNYIDYGIHPNFKPLLLSKELNKYNMEEEIYKLMKICPNAKAVRAHARIHGSPFENIYKDIGLTHESNFFIPSYSNIELKPYKLWNNLISVPYGWEDDTIFFKEKEFSNFSDPVNYIQKVKSGLLVLDFHPIHIFLNTESTKRYENTREIHKKPDELIKYRYKGYGTRNRFIDTLKLISGK